MLSTYDECFQVDKSFRDDALGIMFVGTSFDNLIGPTFSVVQKSTYLNGYYKYIAENDGDNCNTKSLCLEKRS